MVSDSAPVLARLALLRRIASNRSTVNDAVAVATFSSIVTIALFVDSIECALWPNMEDCEIHVVASQDVFPIAIVPVNEPLPNPRPNSVKLSEPVLAWFCRVEKLIETRSAETAAVPVDAFSPTVKIIRRVARDDPDPTIHLIEVSECHVDASHCVFPSCIFPVCAEVTRLDPYTVTDAEPVEGRFDLRARLATELSADQPCE